MASVAVIAVTVVSVESVEVELVPAAPVDEEYARVLHHLAYREVVTEQFGSWDAAKQDKNFQQKWRTGAYQLIRYDGDVVGMLRVDEEGDHLFLSEVQIHPDYQGRGIGTEVVARVVADATERGLPLKLRVLLANRARRLYERFGFEEYGTSETHVLMRREP